MRLQLKNQSQFTSYKSLTYYIMKTFLLFLPLVLLMHCGATKPIPNDTQDWINNQAFTVSAPKDWRAVKHHGYVGYTPLLEGDNFFHTLVSVFEYKPQGQSDFKTFVQERFAETNAGINLLNQDIKTEDTHLGPVYIHTTTSSFNQKTYKRYTVYFEHDGAFYNYNYSALKTAYDNYYDDAISILNSIAFKSKAVSLTEN